MSAICPLSLSGDYAINIPSSASETGMILQYREVVVCITLPQNAGLTDSSTGIMTDSAFGGEEIILERHFNELRNNNMVPTGTINYSCSGRGHGIVVVEMVNGNRSMSGKKRC